MKTQERILNICFGLSLIYWGIAGFVHGYEGFETSVVRIVITVLNITVGILILSRKPVIKKGSISSVLKSLPSLICGGLIFKFAKSLSLWEIETTVLFILGASMTIFSFLSLGKSFSIFPDIREIKSTGLYKWVRHPSYLGEFIMIVSCLLSEINYFSVVVFILFVPSIMWRIYEEEKLLLTESTYLEYQNSVKWRLIPLIW